jgi:hypothetical protein
MTGATVWRTDDCCPRCGGLVSRRIPLDGPVTEYCGCGWSVTWQADPDGGQAL